MQRVFATALLEGPAPWVWGLCLQSTVISLMRHDQGMQNYSWSHILDNLKTTRNTIICSKYREQWGICSASRPSSGASCITVWQALRCLLMAGKNVGSTVQRICVEFPAPTVNHWPHFSGTSIPHPYMHPFNKYLLRAFWVPDLLGASGDPKVSGKRSDVHPREASLMRETHAEPRFTNIKLKLRGSRGWVENTDPRSKTVLSSKAGSSTCQLSRTLIKLFHVCMPPFQYL